jgi:hypothetical protein
MSATWTFLPRYTLGFTADVQPCDIDQKQAEHSQKPELASRKHENSVFGHNLDHPKRSIFGQFQRPRKSHFRIHDFAYVLCGEANVQVKASFQI